MHSINKFRPLIQKIKTDNLDGESGLSVWVEATQGYLNPNVLIELEELWKIKLLGEDRDRYRGKVYRDVKWEKPHRKRNN